MSFKVAATYEDTETASDFSSSDAIFSFPTGMTSLAHGRVLVCDTGNQKIKVLSRGEGTEQER